MCIDYLQNDCAATNSVDRVLSDVCNANCRLDWLGGSGVDLDKLCEADLSDSDDDSKYEGTDLANKSRYIEINSLPGLTDSLLKSSTVKHKVLNALTQSVSQSVARLGVSHVVPEGERYRVSHRVLHRVSSCMTVCLIMYDSVSHHV